MANDDQKADMAEIIEKFCAHLEVKLEADKDLTEEDKEALRSEVAGFRDVSSEMKKFVTEYPNLSRVVTLVASTLHEHENKLELLKDALVANGLIMQVEAKSEEEALAMAKKSMEEEMLSEMLAKVDKSTIH